MRVNIDKTGKIIISDFSPAQAYKIALRMEKDGMDFYHDLLRQVKDTEAVHEIEFLIAQEKLHLETFAALLGQAREGSGDAFEEDDIVDYMNSKVFDVSKEKEEAARMQHRHTALEEALDMERRSIVFYEGCLKNTKDQDAAAAFKKILEEEKSHLSTFAQLLRIKCINSSKGCIL